MDITTLALTKNYTKKLVTESIGNMTTGDLVAKDITVTIDSSVMTTGQLNATQYGKLVIVNFYNCSIKTGNKIFTRLPAPANSLGVYAGILCVQGIARCYVSASGTVMFNSTNNVWWPLTELYGQLVYLTK